MPTSPSLRRLVATRLLTALVVAGLLAPAVQADSKVERTPRARPAAEDHGLWAPFVPAKDGRAGGATTWKVVFDRLTAGDRAGAEAAWGRWGKAILAEARGLPRLANQGGSRNIAPNAAGTAYLYLGSDELAQWLEHDLRAQLGPPGEGRAWGLQGQEQLSTVYLGGVVAVLERVYDAARGRHPDLAEAARDVLRSHAYTLALFATPGGPGGYQGRITLVAPGARSPAPRDPTDLEYILAEWLDARPLLPANRPPRFKHADDLQGVAVRSTWATGHAWLSEGDRRLLRGLVERGEGVEEVVAELQRLGVRFVEDVVVERYRGVDAAAWMLGNPHGVTAPTLAASRIGARRQRLSLHPRPYDSGGPRSLGRCAVEPRPNKIVAHCAGARGFTAPAPEGVAFDRRTATYSGSIRRPPGEPRWRVTIGPRGVRLGA